jgi:hypothetical protein
MNSDTFCTPWLLDEQFRHDGSPKTPDPDSSFKFEPFLE